MPQAKDEENVGLQWICWVGNFFSFHFPTGRIKWLRQHKFPNVNLFPFHSWRMRMINKGFKKYENFACSFVLKVSILRPWMKIPSRTKKTGSYHLVQTLVELKLLQPPLICFPHRLTPS